MSPPYSLNSNVAINFKHRNHHDKSFYSSFIKHVSYIPPLYITTLFSFPYNVDFN